MNPSQFRTNLKTLLDANTTFDTANCKVHKYPPGEQAARSTTAPLCVIERVETVNIADATLASVADRTYTITGGVKVFAKGETDTQWAAAETTAYDLIDAIRTVCRDNQTLSDIATQTRLSSWSLEAVADNSMEGEWTITVRVVN